MCWKSIVENYRLSTRPAVNCEVCKAIEALGLDSSAHDLWACTAAEGTTGGWRHRYLSRHIPMNKAEERASGGFTMRLLQLLPRH
jgi:hypothetical protein